MKSGSIIARIVALGAFVWGLYSPPALAAGDAIQVRVQIVAIASNLGNQVYVKTSAPATGTCTTHSLWTFVLSLDTAVGKNQYAMLLSAQARGAVLDISGNGTCSSDGVEWLRSMWLHE